MSFSKVALDIGKHPFSYSKLSIGHKCPFRFKEQIIKRTKPTNEVDSQAAKFGTAVHTIMEKTLEKKAEAKESLSINELRDAVEGSFEVAVVKHGLTEKEILAVSEIESSVEHMIARILNFQQRTHSKLYIEKKLGIDADFNPVGFGDKQAFFRGVVDLAMVNPNGTVAIIDHKSGYKTLRGHESQLKTYEILAAYALHPIVLKEHGIEITKVRTGINFITDEDILWGDEVSIEEIKNSRKEWFIDWVNTISQNALEGTIKRGRHCNWCGYRSFCGSKVGTRKKKKASTVAM